MTLSGNDAFFGGDGIDELNFLQFFDVPVEVHVQNLILNAAASIEYVFVNTRDMARGYGTAGNDRWDFSGTQVFEWDGTQSREGASFDLMTGADSYTGSITGEILRLSDGNDTVSMGAGNDRVIIGNGALTGSVLNGGLGEDTLQFGDGWGGALQIKTFAASLFTGFEVIDLRGQSLLGTAGADSWNLTGGPFFSEAVPTADMGAGNDSFVGALQSAATTVLGGAGWDTLIGSTGNDNLYGGANGDVLDGGDGDDKLYAGSGWDRITGGNGDDRLQVSEWTTNDTLLGGAGNDLLIIDSGGSGPGTTVILNRLAYDATRSIEALEFINLTVLSGTAGNDVFDLTGFDHVSSSTTVRMQDGADVFRASSSIAVDGGLGNDSLYGSIGSDTLMGGAGVDFMSGGEGGDTYYVDNIGDVVVDSGAGPFSGIDTIVTGLAFRALAAGSPIEALTALGSVGLHGIGNAGDNILTGAAGADWLEGRAGNDRLSATGGGNDTLQGGLGDDSYYDVTSSTKILEYAGGGLDTIYVSGGTVQMSGFVEVAIVQGPGAAQVKGTGQGDSIRGDQGNDTLMGFGGNDTLDGRGGINQLAGGAGDDPFGQ